MGPEVKNTILGFLIPDLFAILYLLLQHKWWSCLLHLDGGAELVLLERGGPSVAQGELRRAGVQVWAYMRLRSLSAMSSLTWATAATPAEQPPHSEQKGVRRCTCLEHTEVEG